MATYRDEQGDAPAVVKSPDKAVTSAVYACTAVGILYHAASPDKRRGYLAHYSPFDTSIEGLLDRAIAESGGAADLEVKVAGNVPPQ
ncbi:hypothetical protein HY640_00255 [Candidatus Woesearchaeota archaeon]|nr:hypothetical protein [Candidatus Woesearchaeota archaeon]